MSKPDIDKWNRQNKVVAAIDVGSSGIRMEIAEIRANGEIHSLESFHRSVLLGIDTFDTGRLKNSTIHAACDALRNYKNAMENLGVIAYRAVATNAVQEAENSDTFIDRVLMSTELDLEIIDGAEQSRLTYAAVEHSLSKEVSFQEDTVALIEVGGGDVDVMLHDQGKAVYADTFGLGAIRIRQSMRHSHMTLREGNSFLRHLVEAATQKIPHTIPLETAQTLIALGGDVRFLANRVLPDSPANAHYWIVPREQFLQGCNEIAEENTDRLIEKYNLSMGDAITLGPALLIYQQIVNATSVDRIIISNANIRDGIFLDMVDKVAGKGKNIYAKQIVASAKSLAKKYKANMKHAKHVAKLALSLFDFMSLDHGLGRHERLLLEVAAILHEIGSFVHNRAYHKHTLYLIGSSEIFGISKNEIKIVANVARYHRRARPHATHPTYMALDRSERVKVCKLAAILRVADAMDKEHTQKIIEPRFVRKNEELNIFIPKDLDIRLEELYLKEKGDLFYEIFGLNPLFIPAS